MSKAEKLFMKCKSNNHERRTLRSNCVYKRASFDKLLRKSERNYNRQLADKIETLNTNDPREFWNNIKMLGPHKRNAIPMQVYDDAGHTVSDSDSVMKKWRSEFENLYNKPADMDGQFDDSFYEYVKSRLEVIENELQICNAVNVELDQDFTISEIKKLCAKLKMGSSTSPDRIPNEILKQEGIQILLLSFINVCLQYSIVPSLWNRADISPIPKRATKNHTSPLITVVSVWYLVCMNCTQVLYI